jgi:endonuclease/exonuclease/phosphatase family metal-dependent hydrolase
MKKITELNTPVCPVILTGDFNGGPSSEPVSYISSRMTDSFLLNGTPAADTVGTFNGFGHDMPARERIDYIFAGKKGLAVTGYSILREYNGGLFPSDHFPVVAEMRFEPVKKP